MLFSHVTQHQTRIIADHFVYSQDFAKLQTLEYQNITAGCALTPKLVCLAHGQEGVISLVAWTGTQYNMIQKASIFSGSLVIDELRKDLFSPLPNQIYMLISQQEQGTQELYRILIDPRSLQQSLKIMVPLTSPEEPIQDWQQVSLEAVLVMQGNQVQLVKIDQNAIATQVQVISVNSPRLWLCPGFDIDKMPLLVDSQEVLLDVSGKGWYGRIYGDLVTHAKDQELEFVGVHKEWVFVKGWFQGQYCFQVFKVQIV